MAAIVKRKTGIMSVLHKEYMFPTDTTVDFMDHHINYGYELMHTVHLLKLVKYLKRRLGQVQ